MVAPAVAGAAALRRQAPPCAGATRTARRAQSAHGQHPERDPLTRGRQEKEFWGFAKAFWGSGAGVFVGLGWSQ